MDSLNFSLKKRAYRYLMPRQERNVFIWNFTKITIAKKAGEGRDNRLVNDHRS